MARGGPVGCGERPGLWVRLRLRRDPGASGGKWRLRKAERPGAPASLCAVEGETPPRGGPRTGRQHPHPAPSGGAELGGFKAAPAVGGNQHPKRVSPGPRHAATREGLGAELGAPGSPENGLIAVRWLSPKQNSDTSDLSASSLRVPSSPGPPHTTGRAALTGRLGSLLGPRRPGTLVPRAKGRLGHSTAPEPAWIEFQTVSPQLPASMGGKVHK